MPLLNSSAGLLTKPNGVVTRTGNTVATHIGPAVRFINKCPRIVALHLPVFHHTKMIKLATGMYMDFGKYIQIGERGYTMERYINCKFGISEANDKLPKRLTDVPQDPKDPKTKVPPKDLNGCVILVNGKAANKRSKLTDGDTVVLMSPVAGG